MRRLLPVVLFLATGCGIGVGPGVVTGGLGSLDATPIITKGLVFSDPNGTFMALLGTAGNEAAARSAAQQAAWDAGGQEGDVVSYEYEVEQPTPGTWTEMALHFGSSDGFTHSSNDLEAVGESHYFGFDVRGHWANTELAPGLQLDFVFGVVFHNWKFDGEHADGTPIEADEGWVGVPMGATLVWWLHPLLAVSAGVNLDPIMSAVVLGVGEGGAWVYADANARIGFRPFEWLAMSITGQATIAPFGFGATSGDVLQASFVLSVIFG